jgi:glucose-1-phosphate thymidylyltransferase
MRTGLIFAGLKPPSPLQAHPSLALHWLAGGTVVSHILEELKESGSCDLIVLAGEDAPAIAAWLHAWDGDMQMQVIEVGGSPGFRESLEALRPHLDDQPLLLAQGSLITQADYAPLRDAAEDIITFTCQGRDAGVCWLRRGADLLLALEGAPEAATFSDLALYLGEHGRATARREATLCLDVSTTQGLLAANARLLTLGHGSEDAIERSYLEDFTVIPPVFVHETAVIEYAVLGPFVHVEAGAVVRNSVLRSTLIGVDALVEYALLDGAAVGDGAQLRGAAQALVLAAGEMLHTEIEIDNKAGAEYGEI